MKLFLVSTSPRRREILEKFGYEFEVLKPFKEDKIFFKNKFDPVTVLKLARSKLEYIDVEEGVLLSADTVVVVDDRILPKPTSIQTAKKFLRTLSGRVHRVYTGYVVRRYPAGTEIGKVECTEVKFKELTESEIEKLVGVENPLDKAGGYAIQGFAGLFIQWIKGDYFNVVGLPISSVYQSLKTFGILPQWLKSR